MQILLINNKLSVLYASDVGVDYEESVVNIDYCNEPALDTVQNDLSVSEAVTVCSHSHDTTREKLDLEQFSSTNHSENDNAQILNLNSDNQNTNFDSAVCSNSDSMFTRFTVIDNCINLTTTCHRPSHSGQKKNTRKTLRLRIVVY